LGGDVELTEERERHLAEHHPDLPADWPDLVAGTLAEPDQIHRDARFPATRLFSRWFEGLKGGKLLVVAVVSDLPSNSGQRHWIVTAYVARKPDGGHVEWTRT